MTRFSAILWIALSALSAAQADDKVPAPIAIKQMVDTFATNEIRAQAMFVDQTVAVKGVVLRVAISRYPPREAGKDSYYLELNSGTAGPADVDIFFFFNQDARDDLIKLRPGQEVLIQGRCEQYEVFLGSRRTKQKDYMEVPVRDCKLIKAAK